MSIPDTFSAQTIQIAIVLNGSVKREFLSLKQIKNEIKALTSGECNVVFPEYKINQKGWRINNIRNTLEKLLNDSDIDIDLIISNGLLSSHQAAQFEKLKKPIIAPVVVDRILQKLPYKDGKSGKNNYVYINDNRTVEEYLRQFYALKKFNHLAIPLDKLCLQTLPQLKEKTYNIQPKLDFKLTLFPMTDRPVDTLASIPDKVDAISMSLLYPDLARPTLRNFLKALLKESYPVSPCQEERN